MCLYLKVPKETEASWGGTGTEELVGFLCDFLSSLYTHPGHTQSVYRMTKLNRQQQQSTTSILELSNKEHGSGLRVMNTCHAFASPGLHCNCSSHPAFCMRGGAVELKEPLDQSTNCHFELNVWDYMQAQYSGGSAGGSVKDP